jgi:hypothetical protein
MMKWVAFDKSEGRPNVPQGAKPVPRGEGA